MSDETLTDSNDEVESEQTETSSAPLENVTSSEDAEQTETQTPTEDQVQTQSKVDYLKVLDGLELDPAVKEQLKAGYLRQDDYTRKTQELAKERGLVDQYKQVQPVIEFLSKNPDLFNRLLKEMNGQPSTGQDKIPQDPKEYAEWVQAKTIEKMMAIQAQEADYQSAAKVDPRLDSDPEFGEAIARMVASDPEFLNKSISALEATKKAVASFDKYVSKAVNSAKLNLSNQAKAKKAGSTVPSSPGSVGGKQKPMSIMDAAKQAEEELAS